MPSLADATRARRSRERRRWLAGVGLLVTGAALVGLGAAGAVGATAPAHGAVVGGLAVLAGLLAVGTRAPLGERERTVVAVGAMASLVSLLLLFAAAGGPTPSGLAALAAGVGYLAGLAVVLAAVLAAASLRPGRRDRSTASPSLAWTRSSRGGGAGTVGDGGSADDDLSVPPEDDR